MLPHWDDEPIMAPIENQVSEKDFSPCIVISERLNQKTPLSRPEEGHLTSTNEANMLYCIIDRHIEDDILNARGLCGWPSNSSHIRIDRDQSRIDDEVP